MTAAGNPPARASVDKVRRLCYSVTLIGQVNPLSVRGAKHSVHAVLRPRHGCMRIPPPVPAQSLYECLGFFS